MAFALYDFTAVQADDLSLRMVRFAVLLSALHTSKLLALMSDLSYVAERFIITLNCGFWLNVIGNICLKSVCPSLAIASIFPVSDIDVNVSLLASLPYLTLPSWWAGCYTCPALRPYQFGPMCNPDVTAGHISLLVVLANRIREIG